MAYEIEVNGARRAADVDGDTPRGDSVDMHRAGAAQRLAAAEFGSGHAEYVAQDPQQRPARERRFACARPAIPRAAALSETR